MQPSLKNILTPERLARLNARGWTLDPSFGNYVKLFAADLPTANVAREISQTLAEAYDAKLSRMEMKTAWVADIPCPPRNGFSQNLAGSVNDAISMRPTAVLACSFKPTPIADAPQDAEGLRQTYGAKVAAELQRLRINKGRRVHVVFQTGIGYAQCTPSPDTIYCEMQSAESWPALAAVLTPERVARLHAAGFADPGNAPNYAKEYSLAEMSDAAIADEILTLLREVYGYNGVEPLKIATER